MFKSVFLRRFAKTSFKFFNLNYSDIRIIAAMDFEPSLKLNNGQKMPMLGLGTYLSKNDEVRNAVEFALDVGYRHIDTAFAYGNEKEIGQALKKKIEDGTVKRENVFIVTKLWNIYHKPEKVIECLKKSLTNLQVDYIDLYLIHNPCGFAFVDENTLFPNDKEGNVMYEQTDHALIWKEMEKAVDQGLVKSIGLSNFNKRQIQYILDNARIKPVNLQVECHAYFMQKPLFKFCQDNGITMTAYGPLGAPNRVYIDPTLPILMENETVMDIAKNHGKTPAQILNRFLIERGRITIPKSINKERIQQNFDVLKIKLTPEELEQLDGLDRNMRLFPFLWCKDSKDFPFTDAY